MIMKESAGDLRGEKLVAHWAYSPIVRHYTSTQADALIAAANGMDVTVAHPEGYDLDPETIALIKKESARTGRKFEITTTSRAPSKEPISSFPGRG
jgi:N-acetylornithine carbamoyltransferase